ncbi:MAG TPA: hypothetical protein VIG99_29725 [Myxococcaceae bacterium]|jgi:hypothetical protein
MAVNLESHGLPVGIAYGAPVTVQDGQGQGQGQQPAQDAGYSNTSAFERATGASVPHAEVQEQDANGGGDLLSKLSGFIRAVGDVVVQLGEYIRSAGGSLSDTLAGEGAAQTPAQAPAAPAAPAAQPQALAPGTPAGAPVPVNPALAAPAQLATAAVLPSQPRQTSPALGARSSEPTSRATEKVAAAGLGETQSTPSAAAAGPRGGGRASQSSGFPVLNPLPPYLGDQMAFVDLAGSDPVAELPAQGHEAFTGAVFHDGPFAPQAVSAQPAVQPEAAVEQAAAVQAAQETGFTDNVIPFPSPAARDSLHGEASNEATGEAAQPEADPASPRYAAVVFRPAFYGNLRC